MPQPTNEAHRRTIKSLLEVDRGRGQADEAHKQQTNERGRATSHDVRESETLRDRGTTRHASKEPRERHVSAGATLRPRRHVIETRRGLGATPLSESEAGGKLASVRRNGRFVERIDRAKGSSANPGRRAVGASRIAKSPRKTDRSSRPLQW